MAYGTVKVDNITFDNGGSDQNVTVSGLYRATTSGVTLSGTIAAATVSGVTVIGSTTISGATVTGTTANFTSGNFSNLISAAATMSGALIMANQQQVRFREAVGNGVNHIALQAPAIVSADQTITLPDQTGTVITTGDNGSVSSTMLATNLTISAAAGSSTTPSIAFTGDLNTGIYSPGADTLAFVEGGTEAMRIDSSGRLLVGTTSARGNFKIGITVYDAAQQLETGTQGFQSLVGGSPSAAGPYLMLAHQRSGAVGGNTVLASGDEMGTVSFHGGDGTNLVIGAVIRGEVDGTPGANDMPGRLVFSTTADGATSPTERLRIDSSGRVGIGTSSPQLKLDVATTGTYGVIYQPAVNLRNTSFDGTITSPTGLGAINWSVDGSYDVANIEAVRENPSSGTFSSLVFRTNPTNISTGAGTERLRIDSSGRVGIGTSSPSYALHLASSGTTDIFIGTGGDDSRLYFTDTNRSIRGIPGGNLTFQTAATERMRITNTGRVGINETNPAQQLAVLHSGVDGISIADVNASSISTNILIANTRAGGFSNYYIYAVSNSALTFQVFSNGNVQNTNNSYGAISDIKLKENIVDANSQWNDLKALQVRKYNFKEGQTHTQIGLVAQEVELVSPGLVAESPDRDEEGNDLGTVTKSVNYSVLYMKAVKALQEAMERIEALEADVALLKSE